MTPEALVGVLVTCLVAILGSMAGLIKLLVSNKLEEIKLSLAELRNGQQELKDEVHGLDIRITRLEVEHSITSERP